MKYKVGDLVIVDLVDTQHHNRFTRATDADPEAGWYRPDADHGTLAWLDEEPIDAHEDCGCNDMDEPIIEGTDKKERIAEVIKWLYINDRKFDSREQWEEELIKFLEEIL